MKAAVCREFAKPLSIEELELAPPGAGEIRVKVAVCAICHSDIHYADGAWGGDLPSVFGHEASGVIEEIGAGVEGFQIGDHVVVTLIRSCGHCYFCRDGDEVLCEEEFSLDRDGPITAADGGRVAQGLRTGAFAEQVVVDPSQVVVIPDEIPFDSASLLACGVITGLGAVVNTAGVEPDSNVVVIGTGGVGLNSIQGAALSDCRKIIAIDISDEKLSAARRFGATHAINSTREEAAVAVRALTDGRGADYAFVTVGVKSVIEQGFRLIRKGGTLVLVGMPASGEIAGFEPLRVANDCQVVLGSKMGSSRIRVDIPRLVDLYRQGTLKLDELISGRYPLEKINEAIASVNRGEALRNVIVF
ncbi:MAG: alcohol dehydrogenase catalytic domain-containing protein [Gammaproteobacteria bacterium]|nr:alcohol dehydrogenase catalytic domain-containing protein [Gammaproteobacteria bacterium]